MSASSLRVLHVLSSTGVHGAETMAIELIRQLRVLGIAPYLALLETPGSTATEIAHRVRDAAVDRVVVPCRGQLDLRSVQALRRYIRDWRIHIVHGHGYKADVYALAARLGTGARLIGTCHNWLGRSLKMRLYAALDKRVLRRFDAVVGVSEDVTAELRRYVPPVRVAHIGNGIDPQAFHRVLPASEAKHALGLIGRRVVGFIGRLTREKGVYDLLEAMRALRAKHPDTHLLIVGDGEERQALEQRTRDLGLDSAVTFTGTRADTALLYSAFDVFVLPSYQEGFPMVVLEAMACNLPVVATHVGDIPRIIDDGATGVLTAPGDTDALVRAVDRVLADATGSQEMGAAAGRRLRERFTSRAMAQHYLALYRRVLDPAAGVTPLDRPLDKDRATP